MVVMRSRFSVGIVTILYYCYRKRLRLCETMETHKSCKPLVKGEEQKECPIRNSRLKSFYT
jgi:hypothetical protein